MTHTMLNRLRGALFTTGNWIAAILPVVFFFPLLTLVGVPAHSAALATLNLLAQALGGLAVLRSLHFNSRSASGTLGLSLALGSTLFVIFNMLVRDYASAPITPGLFLIICFIPVFVTRNFGYVPRWTIPESMLLLVIGIGTLQFLSFWKANPLVPSGWTALYGDITYHQSLAESLVTRGPNSLAALGEEIRYHWLGDGWAGLLQTQAGLPILATLTRVLPIFALVAATLISWEWGRAVGRSARAALLASLFVAVAAVGSFGLASYQVIGAEWSPTHMFGVPVLLALAVVVTGYVSRPEFGSRTLLLIALLSALLTASRAPQMMVALSGTALTAFAVWRLKWVRLRLGWTLLAMAFGSSISYMTVIRGGPGNGMSIRPNSAVASGFGLVPIGSESGGWLAIAALCAGAVCGWSGLLILMRSQSIFVRLAALWGLATGLSGLLFSILFEQAGTSQVTFLWAAAAVTLPLSAVGLFLAYRQWPARTFRHPSHRFPTFHPLALVVLGLTSGWLGRAIYAESSDWRFGGYFRWCLPIALCLLLVGAWYRSTRYESRALATVVMILVPALLTSGLWKLTQDFRLDPVPATSATPLAVTEAHLTAGSWARANLPEDAIVATDRQCGDPSGVPPDCGSMWAATSAFSRRQVLIEAYSYTAPNPSKYTQAGITASWRFGMHPNYSDACLLLERGVGWFWADHATSGGGQSKWDEFGTVEFFNSVATIIKLKPTVCRDGS